MDNNGEVEVEDLLILLGAWGTPNADIDGDGITDVSDLLILLGSWGSCSLGFAQLDGWPVSVEYEIEGVQIRPSFRSSPIVKDINNDGIPEVIVVGNVGCQSPYIDVGDFIGVYNFDGTPHNGWPTIVPGALLNSRDLAVANLDNEGGSEIIVVTPAFLPCPISTPTIFVWDENGELVNEWQFEANSGTGFTVKDIDEDNFLDIALATHVDDTAVRIYAWNRFGDSLNGWPVDINGNYHSSNPAVGDVTGDGINEITVLLRSGDYPNTANSRLIVLSNTGEVITDLEIPNSNLGPAGTKNDPVLGDVDLDGVLEIITGVAVWQQSEVNEKIFAFNGDGTQVWMPTTEIIPKPAYISIFDVENDGCLEIGVSTNSYTVGALNQVTVYNCAGNLMSGWPFIFPENSVDGNQGLVVGDIDGDGILELMGVRSIGSPEHVIKMYAWEIDGSVINGFPLTVEDESGSTESVGSPTIIDLNQDGSVDIVISGGPTTFEEEALIHAFDLPGAYNSEQMDWPMYRRDSYRTADFSFEPGEADCTYNYFCTDTDGGLDYYTSGSVTASWEAECDDGTNPSEENTNLDSCVNSVLTEYYCSSLNTISSEIFQCQFGCLNAGACDSGN